MSAEESHEPVAALARRGTTPVRDRVQELHVRVSGTVAAHPGVLRVEPTLLGSTPGSRTLDPRRLDGIVVDVHDRVVDLEVNLSERAGHQAYRTVVELGARLTELVVGLGYRCGAGTINVLSIEDVPEPPGLPEGVRRSAGRAW